MVEIIPREVLPIPKWLNILFYFALALLIFSIASYFILNSSLRNAQKNLVDLEETLMGKETPENIVLEKEVLNYEKEIKDFSKLIVQRSASSIFFAFIEKICHPKIWFPRFSLNPKLGQATFFGKAKSFESLGQQLLILEDESLVKSLDLEEVSISKEGEINFELSLSLDFQQF